MPYAPGGPSEPFTALRDANSLLSPAEHAAIDHVNASLLLHGSRQITRDVPADAGKA